MEDRNSPEAMAARASQPDPIVMYLVVRESLGMGVGKTAAQCAHASQMLQLKFNTLEKELDNFKGLEESFGSLSPAEAASWAEIHPQYYVFQQWLDTSFRKVVLRASDHQFERLKSEVINHIVVIDAGITEIAPGSQTVIGLWPMYRSLAPKFVQKLQVLK